MNSICKPPIGAAVALVGPVRSVDNIAHTHVYVRRSMGRQGARQTRSAFLATGHDPHETSVEVCETCGHTHLPDQANALGRPLHLEQCMVRSRSRRHPPLLRRSDRADLRLSERALGWRHSFGVRHVARAAITVSILATIAVTAKNWAVALADGNGRLSNSIHSVIEIGGALLVLLLGLTLLSASLAA